MCSREALKLRLVSVLEQSSHSKITPSQDYNGIHKVPQTEVVAKISYGCLGLDVLGGQAQMASDEIDTEMTTRAAG